jgi:hypothetical protein
VSNDLAPIEQNSSAERKAVLIALAVKAVISPNAIRAYASQLSRFLDWINFRKLPFSRQTVFDYRDSLVQQGKSFGTVNLALSAICAVAREAKWAATTGTIRTMTTRTDGGDSCIALA